ncbi:MAG: cytochrome c [Acidobacteriia bacterium]|nr:cytochrome c [Terriglobia bacterium]
MSPAKRFASLLLATAAGFACGKSASHPAATSPAKTKEATSEGVGTAAGAAPVAGTAPTQPPSPSLSYELRLGKDVYQRYCMTCHGETGAGDGFNAFNLNPRPTSLADAAFQRKKTGADLEDAIRRGGAGVGLSSLMPPWGRTLSDRQIDAVVEYLRNLPKPPS